MAKHRVVAVVKDKLSALWVAAQVELQGQYSTQRVQALFAYSNDTSALRVFFVLVLTPLPCLMITTVVDLVHLRPITAGVHANELFFLRAFVSFWVASVMTYVQFKHIVAEVPLSSAQITISGAVVGGLTTAVMYALALVIGFPLPFGIAVVSPAWLTLLLLPLASWIKRVYTNQTVRSHVVNSLKVMMCQETLIVVYPAYFYIFTTIPSSGKTAFALLLPIIKLVLRNFMASAVAHLNDDVPEVVILNVEVFSALFVAYCMQNTPSVKTTIVLMAVDALQMSASLYDIGLVIQRMKTLRRESEARRALLIRNRRQSVEFNLAQAIFNRQMKQRRPSASIPLRLVSTILKLSSSVHPFKATCTPLEDQKETQMYAVTTPVVAGPSGRDLTSSTSLGLEFEYVQLLRKVLYITEFVMLLNYVEVVIPCIFSAYLFIMYHLPNRAYYEQIAGMDPTHLRNTLLSVLLYSGLQLISLVVLNYVLWRKLKFSVLCQLAFVLEKQWKQVQHKLVFWVFYNVQASLQHFGSDYTFKFAWMQKDPRPLT